MTAELDRREPHTKPAESRARRASGGCPCKLADPACAFSPSGLQDSMN